MTRLLIRFILIISSLATAILLLTIAVGYLLPPEQEILFAAAFKLPYLNVYRMSLDRHLVAAVTLDHANNFQPTWSPDGKHIAYISDRDGAYTLYLTDAIGHNRRHLIVSDTNQYAPTWSPDGQQIAFVNEKGGYGEIRVYNMATATSESVTDSYHTHVSPVWYPDGKSITFVSDLDERWNTKIYSVDLSTREVTPIRVGSATNPIWSPDGRYLLYITGYESPTLSIWDKTIGQASVFYTGKFLSSDTPAWSPDGRSIILSALTTHDQSGIFQLPLDDCLKQAASCIPQQITITTGFYSNPQWKPR